MTKTECKRKKYTHDDVPIPSSSLKTGVLGKLFKSVTGKDVDNAALGESEKTKWSDFINRFQWCTDQPKEN